ncbi:serine/threonine-protein kinase pim-1-like isoform X2 [Trichomycterus rosablanca]|uniref:serine/threonine-protein kinase pim-1-like isoform X2 n=1 Tax=Trichomycterus rosablanca TaxID=2290929 RepID=UPI002F351F91
MWTQIEAYRSRRWFLIQNNQLIYKKKYKNSTVVMEDLRMCTSEHCNNIRRRFCFQVVSPTKICILQAHSEENREAWIRAIQNIAAKDNDDRTDDLEELDKKSSSPSGSFESISIIQLDQVMDLSVKQNQCCSSSESGESHQTERDSLNAQPASGASAEISLGEIVLEPAPELDSLSDASVASSVECVKGSVGGETLELTTSSSSNWNHTDGVKRKTTGTHLVQRSSSPSKECFERQYNVGKLLGKGGFGCVYAGVRRTDGKQVAIKYVMKNTCDTFITIPGDTNRLPVEVALMLMVSNPPRCEHVLELLEWFDTPEYYVLILERPDPCMDLLQYRGNGPLSEPLAQVIMWQVVLAARHCCDRGVLHRDIKEENLLINWERLEVKLIDFGCGELLKSTPYKTYSGTMLYIPPEWITEGQYHGCPATVWSLGILLFVLVCGDMPFWNEWEIAKRPLFFTPGVSEACRHLISSCLMKDPNKRPSLEEILEHHWFPESLKN